MNLIVDFIKDHPHCTKFICSTCGGFLVYEIDLDKWIRLTSPDLLGSFQKITFEDVEKIQEWNVFLEQVLLRIPPVDRETAVFPFWIESAGIDLTYDLFIIHHSPINSYNPNRDEKWIKVIIREVISRDLENEADPIIQFVGTGMDQFPELAEYLIYINRRKTKRHAAEKRAESFRIKREEIEKEKKSALHEQLSRLAPKQRLIRILEDPSLSLDYISEEWAIINDDDLFDLESKEITSLINQLTIKLRGKKKSKWNQLRTRMFQIRQKTYNQEKGFTNNVKEEE